MGVIGAVLVAVLIGQRARTEFDRFLSSRDQAVLLDALADYYTVNKSWEGVQAMLAANPALAYYSRSIKLADAEGKVVIGNRLLRPSDKIAARDLAGATALRVNDEIIGYVLPVRREPAFPGRSIPPEADFIERVLGAAATSALTAAGLALVLGIVLAHTLLQPIRELTAATRAVASGKLGQRGLTLRVEAPEGLPSIHVDTDRMTQVLNNLVSNALRHTQKGEIVLSASARALSEGTAQAVRMSVRDTGAGIDPVDLPYVFDRFYRADKARQRDSGDSSGLGLAIAKAIVEAHGGTISAESAPGQGTTFTIILPTSRAKPQLET